MRLLRRRLLVVLISVPRQVSRRSGQLDVELAKIQAKTGRSIARWDKLPWLTGPAAGVGIAWVVAGQSTAIDLNVVANFGLTVAVPAALVKYVWDRRQKQRQRRRLDELERENQDLKVKLGETEGRLQEVRALSRTQGTGRKS